ncbi:hemolysin family protein [Cellulomonas palmilytica]|uniref:hemolysin family protein n=1 Tax=Cellulomonas palmilytica TaxID=2608402 RepID=UPI001F28253B|nr:hemolysin family protein [Cellulomonas palmilytica]UJP41433.1 HlyC/CorC family transporter [Cellulomonas palmilytica]
MLTEWLLVVLGVVLTLGTALFVAGEFSLVTLDPGVVDKQTRPDDRRGQSVLKALRGLSTELSGAQVGITATTVLLGYTTQPAVQTLFSGWLGDGLLSTAAATAVAVVLAVVVVNGFSMLVGELIPKNFAIANPLATARAVAPLQRGFTRALRPVIAFFNGSANWLLRRMGVEPREELSGGRSPSELAALVRRSAEVGTLEQSTARLLTNSLEFETLTAVDVMTDRQRMVAVRRGDSALDVVALARRTGHSRFPVLGEDSDDIVGLVHLRRAVAVPFEKRGEVPAAALMDDAPSVPETVHLGPLLVELRGHGMQMAVVVDEYGGTSGVVTLEDVVEELVGEVADEHDRTRAGVARSADGTWHLPGVTRPDELTERTGLVVPDDGPYETLGGLVMARLGRIPDVGDVVAVGHVRLEVERMAGRRVERVHVWSDPDDEPDEPGTAGGSQGRGAR